MKKQMMKNEDTSLEMDVPHRDMVIMGVSPNEIHGNGEWNGCGSYIYSLDLKVAPRDKRELSFR